MPNNNTTTEKPITFDDITRLAEYIEATKGPEKMKTQTPAAPAIATTGDLNSRAIPATPKTEEIVHGILDFERTNRRIKEFHKRFLPPFGRR